MLIYPDLITSAPADYKGMRDPDPETGRKHKYKFDQLFYLTGRTEQGWANYGRVQLSNGKVQHMPQYLSAYMALLDGAHPLYKVTGFDAKLAMRSQPGQHVPPLLTVSEKTLAEFLESEGITHEEVAEAFDYDPTNKQHSVRKLGNDGVRWAMLTLMCNQHPTLRLVERAQLSRAQAGPTARTTNEPTAHDTHDAANQALIHKLWNEETT